jgi:hypothetical protein
MIGTHFLLLAELLFYEGSRAESCMLGSDLQVGG